MTTYNDNLMQMLWSFIECGFQCGLSDANSKPATPDPCLYNEAFARIDALASEYEINPFDITVEYRNTAEAAYASAYRAGWVSVRSWPTAFKVDDGRPLALGCFDREGAIGRELVKAFARIQRVLDSY